MRKLIAYIDGFSFYRGLTKGTPYRWCDLLKLTEALFPSDDVVGVKLFAGRSKPFLNDPDAPKRQDVYFKALRENPKIEVWDSDYSPQKKYLPLVSELKKGNTQFAHVKLFQEKGADVNLAVNMVIDGSKNLYDAAAIFTNDIDFVDAIRLVRKEYGKLVYLVPTTKLGHRLASMELIKVATNKYFVDLELLARSQLPDTVISKHGISLTKPLLWYNENQDEKE